MILYKYCIDFSGVRGSLLRYIEVALGVLGSFMKHLGHQNCKKDVYDGDMVVYSCLLYTSPSPRDFEASRMPSSA